MLELLLKRGADVNARWGGHYPIIFAACETLQPETLRRLIDHGADLRASSGDNNCVKMLIGTYWRNPEGKHACLEVFAAAGYPFPDTAAMAIHRGRIDLLTECLQREPGLIARRFHEREFFLPELGMTSGLHVAPLEGATLLHMAVEYHEEQIAAWLLDHGADVNARSTIDADGFGGHTPLFHTTVTLLLKKDTLVRLLLRHGADPNLRTTFRKQFSSETSEQEPMREYHDVTPIGFARMFQDPTWVNEPAVAAIREFGGE